MNTLGGFEDSMSHEIFLVVCDTKMNLWLNWGLRYVVLGYMLHQQLFSFLYFVYIDLVVYVNL